MRQHSSASILILTLGLSLYVSVSLAGEGPAEGPPTAAEPAATGETAPAAEGAAPLPSGEGVAIADMEPVVMARVGAAKITVDEFMQFLAKNPRRVREATTVEGKAALLRSAIENHLLLAAMRQEGLIGEDAAQEQMQAAFPKLAAAHFPLPPVPDDEALRAYYEAHIHDFGIPASVRLSQIQFRVPDPATEEDHAAARARAEAALRRIEAGEAFGDVAAEVTEHTKTRPNKGDVGYVTRYGAAWLEKALEGVAVGQHTGIVANPVGYDILLLTDQRDAVVTPFEEAREAVAKRMQDEAQTAARAAYVKQLASKTEITIELDELKGAYPNGIFP